VKQGFSSQPPILKELHVKKIAIALVATATLALAACGGEKATTNTANVSETVENAVEDLENAGAAVEDAAENVTDAATNAADTATEKAENAVDAAN